MIAYSAPGFKNNSAEGSIDFPQDVIRMNGFETALRLLPGRYLQECRGAVTGAEEFRLRVGQPLSFVLGGREHTLPGTALSREELSHTLEKATDASMHTALHALSRGYIQYKGLRIGVCGTAIMHEGRFGGYRSYSSLAIRIPRECRGVCDEVYVKLYSRGFQNTLLLSPPGGGKTTALRELIRKLSDSGRRVAVADERNELSAMDGATAQFDLGRHSDVIVGGSKAESAMMLLRGMNPEIIAMDEITQPEDLSAIRDICGCGVGLLTSVHASEPGDLKKRPLYRRLLAEQVFTRAVLIRCEAGVRRYEVRSLEQ